MNQKERLAGFSSVTVWKLCKKWIKKNLQKEHNWEMWKIPKYFPIVALIKRIFLFFFRKSWFLSFFKKCQTWRTVCWIFLPTALLLASPNLSQACIFHLDYELFVAKILILNHQYNVQCCVDNTHLEKDSANSFCWLELSVTLAYQCTTGWVIIKL